MTWGSVTAPMTFSSPPQRGQVEISIANTRLSRAIQLIGAVWALGASSLDTERVISGRRGTTRWRWRALGANTPW